MKIARYRTSGTERVNTHVCRSSFNNAITRFYWAEDRGEDEFFSNSERSEYLGEEVETSRSPHDIARAGRIYVAGQWKRSRRSGCGICGVRR